MHLFAHYMADVIVCRLETSFQLTPEAHHWYNHLARDCLWLVHICPKLLFPIGSPDLARLHWPRWSCPLWSHLQQQQQKIVNHQATADLTSISNPIMMHPLSTVHTHLHPSIHFSSHRYSCTHLNLCRGLNWDFSSRPKYPSRMLSSILDVLYALDTFAMISIFKLHKKKSGQIKTSWVQTTLPFLNLKPVGLINLSYFGAFRVKESPTNVTYETFR